MQLSAHYSMNFHCDTELLMRIHYEFFQFGSRLQHYPYPMLPPADFLIPAGT